MASITITGTADQLRRIAGLIKSTADSSSNPRSVSITLDNGVANATLAVTDSQGKRKDG